MVLAREGLSATPASNGLATCLPVSLCLMATTFQCQDGYFLEGAFFFFFFTKFLDDFGECLPLVETMLQDKTKPRAACSARGPPTLRTGVGRS